jgi:acyl-[acyl-carrier-protein]-phospholipid O-acyltransferase/long-chain-fatty-acid--[acyl-carrier-protein] ligase
MDQSPATYNAVTTERGLLSPSFLALLATQFLTAMNDNIFRWLVIGIGKDHAEQNVEQILMAGTVCFVAPYLVLSAPAGYLADRYSKRSVILGCKIAEIVIMALGVGAILLGGLPSFWALALLFGTVALMGAQSALFSPARAGSIPETVSAANISKANGIFGLATVVAMVLGTAVGCWLADVTGEKGMGDWWLSGGVLIGMAILGTLTSLPIVTPPPADTSRTFPWDFPVQTWRDLRTLGSSLPLLRVALGIAFFYAVGGLAQLNIDQLAAEGGALGQESAKLPLLLALIAGVSVGSVLAGVWSGDHVELGILPIGAAGVAVSSLLLFTVPHVIFEAGPGMTGAAIWACTLLFFLGTSAGLFSVPLEAYLQHRSPRESRGSILSASNFLTFSGICLASLLFAALRTPRTVISPAVAVGDNTVGVATLAPLMTPQQIFLLAGALTVPVFIYIIWLIPQASIRFFVWLLSKTIYRISVYGRENLPREGGALLVCNHVSWVDGILLLLTSSRPIRMIAWASNFENPWLKRLAATFGMIPILPTRPKTIVAAMRTARDALNNGELVCIFPEGGLTRSGQVQAFRPGMMKILEGTDAPVVPIYLDGLWGSIFSFEGGKFFWKWPKRLRYPVSIHFGPQVREAHDPHEVRQAVLALGSTAVQQRLKTMPVISCTFIRRCKQRKWVSKVSDSTGADLTGGQLLMRSLILRRLLRRHVLKDGEQYVGLLLPPSAAGFVGNAALALDRRIAVNLNYTVTSDVMNACIKLAGIKHVLTSRKFMDKMNFQLDAEVVYLEDFKDKPTAADKAIGVLQSYTIPASALIQHLGLNKVKADDVATVIFTSGSTGTPKGVMLTYANIGSNVEAIDQAVHLRRSDVLIGILPFFHSFGYTITLWGVAGLDIKGAYHFSPLDAKQVGKLCKQHKGTLLLSTPTFLRTYLRRCEKDELATLDVVVAGAEKLPQDLIESFDAKFGVRPVEGYGTTELSPLVSVNIPPTRSLGNFQVDRKEGSVGRPVPGVSAKTVHPETGEPLPAGEAGRLWITGPNVMKGYLHRDDLTKESIVDGWYNTGDIAYIDNEGFIFITGRESRFSKIGGEMVPHIQVEEVLSKLVGNEEADQPHIAVTAVPDEKKGERLIVIHTKMTKTPDELRKGLTAAGLPNLFIPGADSFCEVEKLPILGTGKLDLKGIKTLALERFGSQ